VFGKLLTLILLLTNQSVTDTSPPKKISLPQQLILINLTTKTLEFYDQDKLVFECSVRIGKRGTPTPLGIGFVYEKRDRPIFRYVDPGPQQGQVVNYAECGDGLKKVIHSKMRALGLNMKGEIKYSIHSTTCSETIGKPLSNGCIGMTVPDMLKLYPLVKEGTKVRIVK